EVRGGGLWLGFVLDPIPGAFVPLAGPRGEDARARGWQAYRVALRAALEDAWDGAWYRRAYYDDGTPLGSATGDECRIDALAQAWAVISAAVSRTRAEQAMEAVVRQLDDEPARIARRPPP